MSALKRLALPQVTLCCVDSTRRLPWALAAMRRCLDSVHFGDAILFTDRGSLGAMTLPAEARWVEIAPLRSVEAYSRFMLKELAGQIRTSHLLVVQWDGYVLDAACWQAEFLAYDYIGAPWHHVPAEVAVGNGGFSLRSRRLLEVLAEPGFDAHHPEDACICIEHRDALQARGLRFAPVEVARCFALEDEPMRSGVFGFHGAYHLPGLLTAKEATAFVQSLETRDVLAHSFGNLLRDLLSLARGDPLRRPALAALIALTERAIIATAGEAALTPEALSLAKTLIRYGQFELAERLLRERRRVLGRRWSEPRLRLRLQARRLLAAARRRGERIETAVADRQGA